MTDTMGKFRKIKKLIGKDRMMSLLNCLKFIPDKPYLKLEYRFLTGKKLNIDNPKTYNEKLQYLKLYDRKPIYTQMADKLGMRDYVKERIGEGYTVPLIEVWDSPKEIDFEKLPSSFVLKCNHDSKGLIICSNKDDLDKKRAIKALSKSMKRNMYWAAREWPYKNIKPRVFAEEFISDLKEFQVFCFGGKPKIIYFLEKDENGQLREDFFDMDFNPIEMNDGYPKALITPEKPKDFDRIKEIAAILSEGCPELRVDFMFSDKKLFVGELTFFNVAGFAPIKPESWSEKMGGWIELPERQGM